MKTNYRKSVDTHKNEENEIFISLILIFID